MSVKSLERRAFRRDSDLTESALDRQEIHQALANLDGDQRVVLVLKHLDGLSVKEIAMRRCSSGRQPKVDQPS